MNNKNPITQAVAAMISGDKCVFYRCAFIGLQDTLWDVSGRHYFKFCVIKGGIDFIFGSGQSIYEVHYLKPCSFSLITLLFVRLKILKKKKVSI